MDLYKNGRRSINIKKNRWKTLWSHFLRDITETDNSENYDIILLTDDNVWYIFLNTAIRYFASGLGR